MGNCQCSHFEINIKLQKGNETNKIVLTKKVGKNEEEKKIIFENVKIENDFEQFIDIINTIYNKVENLENENKIFLKKSIKSILSKILDEKPLNKHLEEIEKFLSCDKDLNTIIKIKEIFELFYEKRNDIGKEKLICLITNLTDILKDTNINESYIKCFKNNLENIFLKDLLTIRIINKKKQ